MAVTKPNRVQQLAALIQGASAEELKQIYELYRVETDIVRQRAALSFRAGQHVQFTAKGRIWRGTIEKVNKKTVSVVARALGQTYDTRWNVAPNFLTPIEVIEEVTR